MRKELSVATILKDKPRGIQLFDLLHNVKVKLDKIESVGNNNQETIIWCKILNSNKITILNYSHIGTEVGWPNGLQILKPSQEMRDWDKFAWKKGDVLATDINTYCIFDSWENDAYTQFRAKYICRSSDCHFYSDEVKPTCDWTRVKDNDIIEYYINIIERSKGGKLNLSTLEIEKPQFKDGDIVAIVSLKKYVCIAIYQMHQEQNVAFHAVLCNNGELLLEEPFREDDGDIEIRPATEDEKQQLFDALAKENKAWDAEKKAIVDLPKKCEFKAFDKVLVRDTKDECWRPAFFASLDEDSINEYCYCLIGDPDGVFCKYCIPYNEDTSHLLGTTDDWKGGEG